MGKDNNKILVYDMEGNEDIYIQTLKEMLPDSVTEKITFIGAHNEQEITDDISDVDIVGTQPPLVNTIPRIKDLKWVMTFTSGFDHHINAGVIPDGVPLVNAPGCQANGISEYVILCMLGHVKQIKRIVDNQRKKNFERFHNDELIGKVLGIIGLGEIGREIANKAKAFGMEVIGTKKNVNEEVPNVDRIFPASEYEKVLAESDFIVLALKESPELVGMIGERQFKLMKDTAYLINIARASFIDKDAFAKALKEGWIAGAAQDVWWQRDPLPSYLPPDDELWELDTLLVSAHNSGQTAHFIPRTCKIFSENIHRYVEGKELFNVVKE